MRRNIPDLRGPFLRLTIACALAVGSAASPNGAPVVRPDPRSPMATDGTRIYAVTPDRRSLISAEPGKSDWSLFATLDKAEIRGLTWSRGKLFFTNLADASLQFIPTAGGERVPIVAHRGVPFVRPTEVTFASSIVVADPGAGVLFRIEQSPTGFTPVPLRVEARITDGTFITGWGTGEVVISDGESSLLAQVTDIASDAKYRAMQQRGSSGSPELWNQTAASPETVRRQGYASVHAPGAIAMFNGILYVIDQQSGNVFAAGVHDARAIRLPLPESGVTFSRLLANPVSLTAIDGKSGRLLVWHRVVPSELTLLPGARPQSLFPVLEYLHRRKLLATRTLAITGSVEQTLAEARMTWPARGAPVEILTQVGHFASFCMLNPQHCVEGLPRPNLAPGTPIVLADLYAERYTAPVQVELNQTETLGEIVDAAVTSDEFKAQRTEEYLRRINGVGPKDTRPIRDALTGTFRIPQELVRYVIPIEATELRQGSKFHELVDRVRPVIRIAPLERVLTSSAASDRRAEGPSVSHQDPRHPNDPACVKARDSLKTLLRAINYEARAQETANRTIFVAIAEKMFDPVHPDFLDPEHVEFLHVVNGTGMQPVPPPSPLPAGDTEPVAWRKYADEDHGTAVAALIAGRTRSYSDGFSLTRPFVGLFTHKDDATALALDIERAFNWSLMTVVNLSLKGRNEAAKMRILMEEKRPLALFVVAAPNEAGPVNICEGEHKWYPACHGQTLENVLVVGGTTLDGRHIDPGSPVGTGVHLFAPSTGYYSAGRERSYVEVEGTSFATALVSAAAAMLSSAGVTSPALIRQRLISTATLMELHDNPLWARRLDISRALTFHKQAVMVDAGTQKVRPVSIIDKDATFQFKTAKGNSSLPVPVGNIRRLKRTKTNSGVFELAYVIPGSTQLFLQFVKAPQTVWEVCYFPLNERGLVSGPRQCTDLAELSDYVGPIE